RLLWGDGPRAGRARRFENQRRRQPRLLGRSFVCGLARAPAPPRSGAGMVVRLGSSLGGSRVYEEGGARCPITYVRVAGSGSILRISGSRSRRDVPSALGRFHPLLSCPIWWGSERSGPTTTWWQCRRTRRRCALRRSCAMCEWRWRSWTRCEKRTEPGSKKPTESGSGYRRGGARRTQSPLLSSGIALCS
ncbi:MAG: hypothetical protein QOD76_212, partial [Solirubrobacteraceae bacterium]|nr:hypothetical protein [Solirubrobacteraceae bacterium]